MPRTRESTVGCARDRHRPGVRSQKRHQRIRVCHSMRGCGGSEYGDQTVVGAADRERQTSVTGHQNPVLGGEGRAFTAGVRGNQASDGRAVRLGDHPGRIGQREIWIDVEQFHRRPPGGPVQHQVYPEPGFGPHSVNGFAQPVRGSGRDADQSVDAARMYSSGTPDQSNWT